MKVTPQISADLEEYPELRTIVNAAMRPVVDLMGIHGIVSLKRMHKVGVFDHPYTKDVVTPVDIPGMPQSVKAAQYAAGKALLDYFETIGISGVSLEATQEELLTVAELWLGPRKAPPAQQQSGKVGDGLDPKPVPAPKNEEPEKPGKPEVNNPDGEPAPEPNKNAKPKKEEQNG